MALTARGRALRWLTNHRGLTEEPPGSNRDNRKDGITAAQRRLADGGTYLIGAPWCGTWHANALIAGKVAGVSARQASVAFIEDDAKSHRAPYGRGWVTPADKNWRKKVLRGDAVVLFGHGIHVGTVRAVVGAGRFTYVITDEGNTSSGNAGSQDNGGGAYRRVRPLSAVYGFALVHYPDK